MTDRCNFHCEYCRPAGVAAPKQQPALDDASLVKLISLIHRVCPIGKIRITGGEPLLRRGLAALTRQITELLPGVELGLTTNGALLSRHAEALAAAGLRSVNVSMDTADPVLFRQVTGGGDLSAVLSGIQQARRAGFSRLKINAVLQQRCADDGGLHRLVEVAREHGGEIRFIELMPMGAGAQDYHQQSLSANDALSRLARRYEYRGPLGMNGTASRHLFEDGGRTFTVGFISPISHPFCGECNRLRLDCRGQLYSCLLDNRGTSLRPWLLPNGTVPEILQSVQLRGRTGRPSWPDRSMSSTGG